MNLTTLNDVLNWAARSFEEADLYFGHGTDNAWDEAVALALFVLQLPPTVEASIGDKVLTDPEKETLMALVVRRINERIPVPYLTREAWFADLKFYVDERVIIPRSPMAELILNRFQPWLGNRQVKRILDLCTGGGCLAIAAAFAFPEAEIDAVDLSPAALTVAKKNVLLHHCEDRVKLLQADLFSACQGKRYDLIISNPPYVGSEEMELLPKEFRWEPTLALAAGQDGLEVVKRILQQALSHLTARGLLFVEVGNSLEALQNFYSKTPFTWLEFERGGHGVFLLEAEDKLCWEAF